MAGYPFRALRAVASTVAVKPTLPPFDRTSPTSGYKPGYFGSFYSTRYRLIPKDRSYSADSQKYCKHCNIDHNNTVDLCLARVRCCLFCLCVAWCIYKCEIDRGWIMLRFLVYLCRVYALVKVLIYIIDIK